MKTKAYTTDEERNRIQQRINKGVNILKNFDEDTQKQVYRAVSLISFSFEELSLKEFVACGLDKWLEKIQNDDGLIPLDLLWD